MVRIFEAQSGLGKILWRQPGFDKLTIAMDGTGQMFCESRWNSSGILHEATGLAD